MKHFIPVYSKLFAALLPVLLLWSLILSSLPPRSKFAQLKNDCNDRSLSIYDRLESDQKVNVLFLGSSRTLNAIDDRTLSNRLGQIHYNAGYCRFERNLSASFLRLALANHAPRAVILEIGYREQQYAHPVTANLSTFTEVIGDYPNKDWLKNSWKAAVYRTELLQRHHLKNQIDRAIRKDTFTYQGLGTDQHYQPPEALWSPVDHPRNKDKKPPAYALHYLQKIAALCKAGGTKLYFLYLPAYKYQELEPVYLATYESLGEVWFPPRPIYTEPGNWYDDDHLNQRGTAQLTEWLISKFQ